MRVELGSIIPVLEGWVLCIGECGSECTFCVKLPDWASDFSIKERIYLSLYLSARMIMDYRLAAAMHIYSIRERIVLKPETLVKALRESKVESRLPKVIENNNPYTWEAVLYKGIVYAQPILELEKPVLVKIEPPKNKHEREKLRVLLEGKRVVVNNKTYHVGGLIKKMKGKRIAPWIYIIPKKNLPKLQEAVKQNAKTITYKITKP